MSGVDWLSFLLTGAEFTGRFFLLSTLITCVALYFHFQLLTDLAALADRGQEGYLPLSRRLRLLANADAVFRVAFCLLPYLANWRWVELLIAMLSLLWLGTCAVICCGLFALRRLYPRRRTNRANRPPFFLVPESAPPRFPRTRAVPPNRRHHPALIPAPYGS